MKYKWWLLLGSHPPDMSHLVFQKGGTESLGSIAMCARCDDGSRYCCCCLEICHTFGKFSTSLCFSTESVVAPWETWMMHGWLAAAVVPRRSAPRRRSAHPSSDGTERRADGKCDHVSGLRILIGLCENVLWDVSFGMCSPPPVWWRFYICLWNEKLH